jgi:protein-tyrosine-phosphatase
LGFLLAALLASQEPGIHEHLEVVGDCVLNHHDRRGMTFMTARPSVLFVCVHNAGRSQMAAGYLRALAGDRVEVRSAGSEPADQINQAAVAAMAEDGIDIAGNQPRILTAESVKESDVVITMGCGDTCPIFPGKRYEDWDLDDPAGRGIDAVRPIRDEIKARIERLLAEILPAETTDHENPGELNDRTL